MICRRLLIRRSPATEDTAFVFALADFGFSDVETSQLQSIAVTTLSSKGTLALNGSTVTLGQSISRSNIEAGNLKFTPATNANGTGYDSFKFTVNDGVADSSASSTMTIDVTAVNDLPTASDKTVTATEDTAFVFALADFGFSDVETSQLQSIAVTTLSSKGTLALNGSTVTLGQSISRSNIEAGNLKFTPATNANGTGYDSFKFTVNDGVADSSASSTMTIDVTAVNDSPVGVTDSYTTLQNTQLTGTVGSNDLLQNDSDADPDVLAVNTTPVSNVANGTLTLATDGSFTYSPSSTFFGSDSFTYQVTDGNGGTDTANVTISVTLKPDVFQPLSTGNYDSTGTWDQGAAPDKDASVLLNNAFTVTQSNTGSLADNVNISGSGAELIVSDGTLDVATSVTIATGSKLTNTGGALTVGTTITNAGALLFDDGSIAANSIVNTGTINIKTGVIMTIGPDDGSVPSYYSGTGHYYEYVSTGVLSAKLKQLPPPRVTQELLVIWRQY
jgi:hypothetical protein